MSQPEVQMLQRTLLEAMGDGVFIAQDHRFVFVNPALPALLGGTADRFVGLPFEALVAPDSLALWTQRFEALVGHGAEPPHQDELQFLNSEGRRVWVELRANPLRYEGRPAVLGIVRDISRRKRVAAALEAERQLAQAMLDGLTAHVCVLDAQGTLVSCNAAWREFAAAQGSFGGAVNEGANYLAVCDRAAQAGSTDAVQVAAGLRRVLAGEARHFELTYPCDTPQGARWFTMHAQRAPGSLPLRLTVAHEDVTGPLQAEQRIQHLQQRLAMAVRGAGYGVWELNLADQALIWDEQMHLLYGYAPGSFDGTPASWQQCIHPDDRAFVDAEFQGLMTGGVVDALSFRILRASDGALRHIGATGYLQRDSAGQPQRLVGMNRDITQQVLAQAALRDSEERWKFALEGAGDGVWDWDVHSDQAHFSPRWKSMLGYGDDEIAPRGDEWRRRVHPDDLPLARQALQGHVGRETPTYAVELRMRCKNGQWKWILARGLVVKRDAEGRPLRVVGTHSDLTERKQAEAQRQQLEAQLRDAQKMEAIGTLAGGVAHDFNNLLAAILGNVALARQDAGANAALLASLDQIQKAGLRARHLVQQILAFSRNQPQQLVHQPLQPVVEEALSLLRATLPALVTLEAEITPTPLHAMADATQVQQVLMNLCTNAWHAMGERPGRIVVGLDEVRVPDAADRADGAARAGFPGIDGLAPGRWARLWVRDFGCGIDTATLPRIFDPFFTTKPVGQGTGLGLSVVHGIVNAHRGHIHAESQPGLGSSFHVYLPAVDAPPLAPQALRPAASAHADAPAAGRTLFYIDDDEVMVAMVERLLQRAGYTVHCFQDPRAALRELQANPQGADLVVTDFNMPGCSGLDVARELVALRPGLPLILSSGYISDSVAEQARALGVRALLHKERTIEELTTLVRQVLQAAPPA